MTKTRAADLDLFLLALVRSGLATPYDLMTKAGLSVGSTAPVLRRLEDDGLLKAAKTGSRNSRRFSITTAGEEALDSQWDSLLAKQPTDFDAITRTLFIAWSLGRRDTVAKFIEKSITTLTGMAATRTAEANQLQAALGPEPTGETVRWLRTMSSAGRLRAEARVLQDALERLGASKRKK